MPRRCTMAGRRSSSGWSMGSVSSVIRNMTGSGVRRLVGPAVLQTGDYKPQRQVPVMLKQRGPESIVARTAESRAATLDLTVDPQLGAPVLQAAPGTVG